MNNAQVITLRMPSDLKVRLEREAKYQGVSLNHLANYMLALQVTQLEMTSTLETRLKRKSVSALKKSVAKIIEKVSSREVPKWDRVE